MPCDSIRTTNVEFGPNTDGGMMFDALTALNLSPNRSGAYIYFQGGNYNTNNNTLTLLGENVEERTSKVKQAYSGAVVKSQAKKYGWKLKETAEFQYEVVKRTY